MQIWYQLAVSKCYRVDWRTVLLLVAACANAFIFDYVSSLVLIFCHSDSAVNAEQSGSGMFNSCSKKTSTE